MTDQPENRTESFVASYAGVTDTLSTLRADLGEFLRRNQAGVDLVDRTLLALTELAANAIEASPDHEYVVSVRLTPTMVTAQVRNTRARLKESANQSQRVPPRSEWGPEQEFTPRGRGLLLVEALTDSLDIDEQLAATTATITLSL